MQLVIVEGNISAGKSTLCRELAKELGFELFLEPVVTNPYLELYYSDPKKYGLKMQLWLMRQRFVMYCRALRVLTPSSSETSSTSTTGGAKGVVLDRSLMSDIVFADKNLVDGNITEDGYAVYQALRTHLLSLVPLPDAVVYLDATAEVCHERIHGVRKRSCESGIPLAYLAGLDECYRTFLDDMAAQGVLVAEFDWRDFKTAASSKQVAQALFTSTQQQQKTSSTPCDSDDSSVAATSAASASSTSVLTSSTPSTSAGAASVASAVASVAGSDEAVLNALVSEALPAECAGCFEDLYLPDMVDARDSLNKEVEMSAAEGETATTATVTVTTTASTSSGGGVDDDDDKDAKPVVVPALASLAKVVALPLPSSPVQQKSSSDSSPPVTPKQDSKKGPLDGGDEVSSPTSVVLDLTASPTR